MSKRKNLPTGMSEESIRKVYDKELSRHSDQLIEEIKAYLTKPIYSDVTSATVEVFPDEYGDGYTTIGLYLSGDKTTHVPFAEYVDDLPLIDVESYADEIHIPNMVVDLTKQWFAECWWKACGWGYKLPMEIYGHEDSGDGNSIQLIKDC